MLKGAHDAVHYFILLETIRNVDLVLLSKSSELAHLPHPRAPQAHALPASQYTGWPRQATISTRRGHGEATVSGIISGCPRKRAARDKGRDRET